ncbi:MAG: hypothetical protein JNM17_18955 [Archangium sp.]|nr:hypothetical protein [Archangium sp.]
MVLALAATLLAAAPTSGHTEFRMRLDVGGLVGSAWYVPQTRKSMLLAMNNAKDSFFGDANLSVSTAVGAMPIVGPLMLLKTTDLGEDRALLITTAAMQLLGTTIALKRLILESGVNEPPVNEPQITFSPIVNGNLGFAVRITGF